MKNYLIKIGAVGLISSFAIIPLQGNAYYCNKKMEYDFLKAEASVKSSKTVGSNEVIQSLGIKAKSFALMDNLTGEMILGQSENIAYPMASMTKMMTLLLVMEEVDAGRIDMNQKVRISEYSASQEGSECFLDANKEYLVKELIKSVVVASANDSTVALAELVSGSEGLFVKRMNDMAKELGLKNCNFKNSTGLDIEGHSASAQDMCMLMRELSKHERLQEYSHIWMYDMQHDGGRVTSLTNTNRLIKTDSSVVLAKTGHTDGAGYCITAFGRQDGKEFIACVMGESDSKDRFSDASKLLNFGYANYNISQIVKSTDSVGSIKVKGGKQKELLVYPGEDINVLLQKEESADCKKIISLPEQLPAPIKKGEKVGEMLVRMGDKEYSCELVAGESVEEKTFADIVKELM